MNQDRLIEIETKLAFQEDAIRALNETVYRQEQRIGQLEAALAELIQRYRQLYAESGGKPADEKPPHY